MASPCYSVPLLVFLVVSLLFVEMVVVVAIVAVQTVAAGVEPVVVVVGEGRKAWIAHKVHLVVVVAEDRYGLGNSQMPMDRKAHVVVEVAVVVAAVCVDPGDNLLILFRSAPCNSLTAFGRTQGQWQRSSPLQPWQHWQRQ
jgi:hypothetical protein